MTWPEERSDPNKVRVRKVGKKWEVSGLGPTEVLSSYPHAEATARLRLRQAKRKVINPNGTASSS